jgi:hypothetical protein
MAVVAFQRRQGGERVLLGRRHGVIRCRLHERLGADIVARDQRQGEQQFVLDQRLQIDRRLQSEHVFVAFDVERRGSVFALDEEEPAIDDERNVDRLQAALALHRKYGLGCERKGRLRTGAMKFGSRTLDIPGDWRSARHRFGTGGRRQANESGQLPLATQRCVLGREGPHVEPSWIETPTGDHRSSVRCRCDVDGAMGQ